MPQSPRSRRAISAALVLFAILAALFGATVRMGYWGGPIFTWVPATTAPAPDRRGLVAVYFSGDTGFNYGMGPRVADRLAANGIPVLGVNSLTAFATRRTPAEAAALVRDAATTALARPGARHVLLIGHSFGANVLLGGANGLPAAVRARVARIVFIVPGDTQLLRATPGGYLDVGRGDGPAVGLARALTWVPTLCIHGATEADSLCPLLHQPNVAVTTLPGDHYLNHDDAAVARVILALLTQPR